ncbi:replication protein [Burkholderia cepacia]|uniref:replication protein n=1 Tax=Burkholderia cepacia TaxID=292 RepID=UPI001C93BD4B|nr:replication protein [Burkholderia cepacia]MBY4799924.1 replication protein [Burkholderia cepacia]
MDNASPQLENGFTRLANDLLDALLSAGLTARQWAVVMAVARKTYGWNKSRDDIGLSQFRLMTGIDKSHLSRTIRELEGMRILNREEGMHSHTLGINKRHKDWQLPNQQPQLPKQPQLPIQQPLLKQPQLPNQQPGVAESATKGLPIQQPGGCRKSNHKIVFKEKKDNSKRQCASALTGELVERFATFYAAYPKKRNRADAEKAFAKLSPDDSLLAVLLKAVEVAKRSRDDWRRENGKFIPYPGTWLNGRMWEDEPDQVEYTAAEQDVMDAYNELMPADWARAITAPFSAQRAAAIRDFIGFAPNKPDMPRRYFGHCATNLKADDRCGFDWLIKRETYLRVREGVVKHKDAA